MKELNFIGIIHSPYKTRVEAPRQGSNEICTIEIFERYKEGLKDIEGFSHLHIIYWLHKSDGFTLSVITPWDDRPHGLFATRSPNRVNPVGYAAVELLEKKDNVLKVRGLDAIEATPVIDIKPYIPNYDSASNATVPSWVIIEE